MVTTMAESGTTGEQVEFFIVNSQNIPKLPDEEPIWSLQTLTRSHDSRNPEPNHVPPVQSEQNTPTSKRRPGIIKSWPPADWRSAPGFDIHRVSSIYSFPGPTPNGEGSSKDLGKPLETSAQVKDFPDPVQIEGDWIIEEALVPTSTSTLQSCDAAKEEPCSVESVLSGPGAASGLGKRFSKPAEFPERDFLHLPTPDEQSRKTGRIGEFVAYKYFSEKLGSEIVKWVNEEKETGLPYDLIIGDKEESKEYIEVKATVSLKKDWFAISMREWQFAVEMGDSFSIAHVVLLGPKKASITVLRNPFKLCQQYSLRLAIVMSRQLRESQVTA